ncbi:MAG: hypothetical protein PHQ19_06000 [Candidatus Krumholzibacteria bacterium]|nr:hypothetical protein [Candidatus Krumholzibacteria bacterium]
MRTALILVLAGALCAAAAAAGAAHFPYIGLYADQGHSDCDWEGPPFSTATFWVWVLPGDDGIFCAEFEIVTPANVINASTGTNPEAGYSVGDALVAPGTTICFPDCRTDWVWTHSLACLIIDSSKTQIRIEPHGDYGIVRAAVCTEPVENVEMVVLTHLFINQTCAIGDRPSSWGAVKQLLR